jgi:hypothetical protein
MGWELSKSGEALEESDENRRGIEQLGAGVIYV